MADAASLARFFAGPPLGFVTAWRHRVAGGSSPHAHESIEIVYHRRGRGHVVSAEGTTAFPEGSVVVHPPLALHDQRMDTAGEDVCVHLRATRPLPPALRRQILVPELRDAWLRSELEALAGSPKPSSTLAARSLSLRATALLAALVVAEDDDAAPAGADPDGAMAAARTFLAAHLHEPIAIADVARHVGLGPDHLRHRFSQTHGKGVVAWLHALRVARAKDLLAHAPMPLAEVARLCGFGTDRYLSQVFRRETGMTPGEFRRRELLG